MSFSSLDKSSEIIKCDMFAKKKFVVKQKGRLNSSIEHSFIKFHFYICFFELICCRYMLHVVHGFYLYLYMYLSVTSHINCNVARYLINDVYLTACAFIRS